MTREVDFLEKKQEGRLPINRQVINVLMDSPFYFSLSVTERKEMVERIATMLKRS